MELSRHLAWGVRVRVDDEGVTRRGLLSRKSMRWEEIDDYRIEVRIPTAPMWSLGEFARALSGTASLLYEIELRSDGTLVPPLSSPVLPEPAIDSASLRANGGACVGIAGHLGHRQRAAALARRPQRLRQLEARIAFTEAHVL